MTAAPDLRRRELAAIHVAKKALGLDDQTYRDVMERVTGQRSASTLTDDQRRRLIEELRRLGFKPAETVKRAGRRPRANSEHARKIRALWLSLYQLGAVNDPAEAAMTAFVRRQAKVDDIRWLTPQEAFRAIEALKAWCMRVDYAAEEPVPPDTWDAGLARAQWDRLQQLGAFTRYATDTRRGTGRLDTWLARMGWGHVSAVHFLGHDQQRQVVEELGRWIRREIAARKPAAPSDGEAS